MDLYVFAVTASSAIYEALKFVALVLLNCALIKYLRAK